MGTGLALGESGLGAPRKKDSRRLPRPFLKWAGGKTQVVESIVTHLPREEVLRRYLEPFVGGGALFFWIRQNLPSLQCRIADRNAALVDTYRVVRDSVEELIEVLRGHAENHSAEHYYAVRRNDPRDAVQRAARLVYLNRTCYNGLWRVNRAGRFNVPLGRYKNPRILDEHNLRAVSQALQGVEVLCQDFEETVRDGGPGDLVYFDPPYQPVSQTSYFTAYTSEGFDLEAQRRLARTFVRLHRLGASVILSNSDVGPVRQLYQRLRPQPIVEHVRVSRSINSNGGRRGTVGELLVYGVPDVSSK